MRVYRHGGGYHPGDDRPKRKGVSQQERKDYAEMKAEQVRSRRLRRAERKGQRAERKGEEPVGYRETVTGGNPRYLQESGTTRTPIYQDEYEMLQKAAAVDPQDYYYQKLLSGVRKGGKMADPCRGGEPGAGANVACSPRTAKKVAKRRQGKKFRLIDRITQRLVGEAYDKSVGSVDGFNPYNDQDMERINRDMASPLRGVKLYDEPFFAAPTINYQ
ncbi:MAG: hypothetical protein VXB01_11430 [Opitutae bacterium]